MTRAYWIAAFFAAGLMPGFAQETTTPAAPAEPEGTLEELPTGRDAVQPGQGYLLDRFTDWTLRCVRLSGDRADPCQMHQTLLGEDGSPTAEVNIFNINRPELAAAGTFVTPLETLLSRGIIVSVDGGEERSYPFTFCNPQGCVAQVGFTPEDIAAFRAGNSARLVIFPVAAPDTEVPLTMSLSGFTAGFNALTALE